MTEEQRKNDDEIQAAILKDIRYDDCKSQKFSLDGLEPLERYRVVYGFLKSICDHVGCHSYLFVLCITRFVECYGDSAQPVLFEILNPYFSGGGDTPDDESSRDVAFAAFYCLGHHFYRQHEEDKLRHLLKFEVVDDNGEIFKDDTVKSKRWEYCDRFGNDYPLIFELLCKYYDMMHDPVKEFKVAVFTQKKLAALDRNKLAPRESYEGLIYRPLMDGENYVGNIGLNIAYASALCTMLENVYNLGLLSSGNDRSVFDDKVLNIVVCNDDDLVVKAYDYISYAIAYNGKYGKYYYLRAKICYYYDKLYAFLSDEKTRETIMSVYGCLKAGVTDREKIYAHVLGSIDRDVLNKRILRDITTAVGCENPQSGDYDRRVSMYEALEQDVKSPDISQKDINYYNYRELILRAVKKPESHELGFIHNADEGVPFVFISYSSQDYKQVYCDLLEMNRRRINFWFDKDTEPGEDWRVIVKPKIKKCACVVFYVSYDSIISGNVLDEINYAYELGKPVIGIDLSGRKVMSKVLASAGEKADVAKKLTTSVYSVLSKVFPDDHVIIVRAKSASDVFHINKLYENLLKRRLGVVESITVTCRPDLADENDVKSWACRKLYGGSKRPYEDYLVCDEENGIFAVADGITRKAEEYQAFGASISSVVSRTFCSEIRKGILRYCFNGSDNGIEQSFVDAFMYANARVNEVVESGNYPYLKKRKDGSYLEPPGCVAVVAFIVGKRLYIGGAGDCVCVLIRGNHRIILCSKQTDYAFKELDIEDQRKRLYGEIVNIGDNPYGYGAINGNVDAYKFFTVSHFDLEEGDVVYLASDGIADAILYGNPEKIARFKPDCLRNEVEFQHSAKEKRKVMRKLSEELGLSPCDMTYELFDREFEKKYKTSFDEWFKRERSAAYDDDKTVIKIVMESI